MNAIATLNYRSARLIASCATFLILSACQQTPAPPNSASEAAAKRAAEAAMAKPATGNDKLTISVDGDKNSLSKGSWVHVRVIQAGNSVAPAEGACVASDCSPGKGFSQTDPGVYVYSFTPAVGAKSISFMLSKDAQPSLVFSTTEASGKVKVSWQGMEKVYDLYQPASDTTQHPPIKLDQPLPETY
jgi:hypothetical protein